MRALPLLVLLPLAGCAELFEGKRAEQSTLTLTLVNRCAQPTEVCYGAEKCLKLSAGAIRSVQGDTQGTGVIFVHLKAVTTGTTADATFSNIEVEESCTSLRRRVQP
jgi:hypothetical protein